MKKKILALVTALILSVLMTAVASAAIGAELATTVTGNLQTGDTFDVYITVDGLDNYGGTNNIYREPENDKTNGPSSAKAIASNEFFKVTFDAASLSVSDVKMQTTAASPTDTENGLYYAYLVGNGAIGEITTSENKIDNTNGVLTIDFGDGSSNGFVARGAKLSDTDKAIIAKITFKVIEGAAGGAQTINVYNTYKVNGNAYGSLETAVGTVSDVTVAAGCKHEGATDLTPEQLVEAGKENVAATCLAEGKKWINCEDCGIVSVTIEKLDHSYTKETIITPATCETDGEKAMYCSTEGCTARDEATVTKIPRTGHNFANHVTVSETCTEAGYEVYVCTACDRVSIDGTASGRRNYRYIDGAFYNILGDTPISTPTDFVKGAPLGHAWEKASEDGEVAVYRCTRENCGEEYEINLTTDAVRYVKTEATGTGDGSSAANATTLAGAFDYFAQMPSDLEYKIYLVGKVELKTPRQVSSNNTMTKSFEETKHDARITITTAPDAEKAELHFVFASCSNYFLYGPTVFDNIKISSSAVGISQDKDTKEYLKDAEGYYKTDGNTSSITIAGRGFPLTLTENVEMLSSVGDISVKKTGGSFTYAVDTRVMVPDCKIYLVGGFVNNGYYPDYEEADVVGDMTILGGTYYLVAGASRHAIATAGKTMNITLGGNAKLGYFHPIVATGGADATDAVVNIHYKGGFEAANVYRAQNVATVGVYTVNHFFHNGCSAASVGDFLMGADEKSGNLHPKNVNTYYTIENPDDMLYGLAAIKKSETYREAYKETQEHLNFVDYCNKYGGHDFEEGKCSFCGIYEACADGHGAIELVEIAATCTIGEMEFYCCPDCNFVFADEDGKEYTGFAYVDGEFSILSSGEKRTQLEQFISTPALGHTWSETGRDGDVAHYVCSRCGEETDVNFVTDTVRYVKNEASGTGDGLSAANATTLVDAFEDFADLPNVIEAVIHLVDDVKLGSSFATPEFSCKVVITGDDSGKLSFTASPRRFHANGEIEFKNLEFYAAYSDKEKNNNSSWGVKIFAQNHPITFGEGIVMGNEKGIPTSDNETTAAKYPLGSKTKMYVFGGYEKAATELLNTNITIRSGDYWVVAGWNGYASNSYGTSSLTVGKSESSDYLFINYLIGLSSSAVTLTEASKTTFDFDGDADVRLFYAGNFNASGQENTSVLVETDVYLRGNLNSVATDTMGIFDINGDTHFTNTKIDLYVDQSNYNAVKDSYLFMGADYEGEVKLDATLASLKTKLELHAYCDSTFETEHETVHVVVCEKGKTDGLYFYYCENCGLVLCDIDNLNTAYIGVKYVDEKFYDVNTDEEIEAPDSIKRPGVHTWENGVCSKCGEEAPVLTALYVANTSKGTGDGSSAANATTLRAAFDYFANVPADVECTIYLVGKVNLVHSSASSVNTAVKNFEETKHEAHITITTAPGASKGTLNFTADCSRYFLYGPTTFDNIKISSDRHGFITKDGELDLDANGKPYTNGNSPSITIAARGFEFTATKNLTMVSTSEGDIPYSKTGGSFGMATNVTLNIPNCKLYLVGGFLKDGTYNGAPENLEAHLNIYGGQYWVVAGSSRDAVDADNSVINVTFGESAKVGQFVPVNTAGSTSASNAIANVHYFGDVDGDGKHNLEIASAYRANSAVLNGDPHTVNHFFHVGCDTIKIGDYLMGAKQEQFVNTYFATYDDAVIEFAGYFFTKGKDNPEYFETSEMMSFTEWCIERNEAHSHDIVDGKCTFCDLDYTCDTKHGKTEQIVVFEGNCLTGKQYYERCTVCFEHTTDIITLDAVADVHNGKWEVVDGAYINSCVDCHTELCRYEGVNPGVFYVSDKGDGRGGFTADFPTNSLSNAYDLAVAYGDDAIIYIVGSYTIKNNSEEAAFNAFVEPAHEHSITVAGYMNSGVIKFADLGGDKAYVLSGDTKFEKIEFSSGANRGNIFVIARHNHLTFGENVTADFNRNVLGGTNHGGTLVIIGGCYSAYFGSRECTESITHVTLRSGNVARIILGSFQTANKHTYTKGLAEGKDYTDYYETYCGLYVQDENGVVTRGQSTLEILGDVTVKEYITLGSYGRHSGDVTIVIDGNITVGEAFMISCYNYADGNRNDAANDDHINTDIASTGNVTIKVLSGSLHAESFKATTGAVNVRPIGATTMTANMNDITVYVDSLNIFYNVADSSAVAVADIFRHSPADSAKISFTPVAEENRCEGEGNVGGVHSGGTPIEDKTKPSTCCELGYTTYDACEHCGEEYVIVSTILIPHTYGDTPIGTVAATCMAPAVNKYACSCGHIKFESYGSPVDHDYGDGYNCVYCGKEKECDHEWSDPSEVVSSCTTTTVQTCTICGKVQTLSSVGAHDFGKYTIVVEPTTEAPGVKTRKCKDCGKVDSALVYAGSGAGEDVVAVDEYGNVADFDVAASKLSKTEKAALDALLQDTSYGSEIKVSYKTEGEVVTNVKYSIPVPAQYADMQNVKIVIKDDNGNIHVVDFEVEKGYIVFTF